MARILKTFATGELLKRLVGSGGGGLVACTAWSVPVLTVFRRNNTHESSYEKNVDDQLNATTVPDELIKPESDKYWGPNPNTGVFGPESNAQQGAAAKRSTVAGQHSVLEETAWFRPTSLEDLEKSP